MVDRPRLPGAVPSSEFSSSSSSSTSSSATPITPADDTQHDRGWRNAGSEAQDSIIGRGRGRRERGEDEGRAGEGVGDGREGRMQTKDLDGNNTSKKPAVAKVSGDYPTDNERPTVSNPQADNLTTQSTRMDDADPAHQKRGDNPIASPTSSLSASTPSGTSSGPSSAQKDQEDQEPGHVAATAKTAPGSIPNTRPAKEGGEKNFKFGTNLPSNMDLEAAIESCENLCRFAMQYSHMSHVFDPQTPWNQANGYSRKATNEQGNERSNDEMEGDIDVGPPNELVFEMARSAEALFQMASRLKAWVSMSPHARILDEDIHTIRERRSMNMESASGGAMSLSGYGDSATMAAYFQVADRHSDRPKDTSSQGIAKWPQTTMVMDSYEDAAKGGDSSTNGGETVGWHRQDATVVVPEDPASTSATVVANTSSPRSDSGPLNKSRGGVASTSISSGTALLSISDSMIGRSPETAPRPDLVTAAPVKGAEEVAHQKYKKRAKRMPLPGKCLSCDTSDTPEWRRGPDGARTLCNACGLHYAKLLRRRQNKQLLDHEQVPTSSEALRLQLLPLSHGPVRTTLATARSQPPASIGNSRNSPYPTSALSAGSTTVATTRIITPGSGFNERSIDLDYENRMEGIEHHTPLRDFDQKHRVIPYADVDSGPGRAKSPISPGTPPHLRTPRVSEPSRHQASHAYESHHNQQQWHQQEQSYPLSPDWNRPLLDESAAQYYSAKSYRQAHKALDEKDPTDWDGRQATPAGREIRTDRTSKSERHGWISGAQRVDGDAKVKLERADEDDRSLRNTDTVRPAKQALPIVDYSEENAALALAELVRS